MLLRAMSGMSRQAGKAAFAAATAASTSAGPAARHAGDDLAGRRVVDGPGLLGQDLDGRPSIQWERIGSVAGGLPGLRAHIGCHGLVPPLAMRQDARVTIASLRGLADPCRGPFR